MQLSLWAISQDNMHWQASHVWKWIWSQQKTKEMDQAVSEFTTALTYHKTGEKQGKTQQMLGFFDITRLSITCIYSMDASISFGVLKCKQILELHCHNGAFKAVVVVLTTDVVIKSIACLFVPTLWINAIIWEIVINPFNHFADQLLAEVPRPRYSGSICNDSIILPAQNRDFQTRTNKTN